MDTALAAAVEKTEEPRIRRTQKALNPILDGKSICVLIILLLAGITTTSDNADMLPYNRSYYLRAPHLLRVGRPIGLPRIGRVPQCARFTHFGGWYVLRRIIASFYGTGLLRLFSVTDRMTSMKQRESICSPQKSAYTGSPCRTTGVD